jgi:hypothetical protein
MHEYAQMQKSKFADAWSLSLFSLPESQNRDSEDTTIAENLIPKLIQSISNYMEETENKAPIHFLDNQIP